MDSAKYKTKWIDIELETLDERLLACEAEHREVSDEVWGEGIAKAGRMMDEFIALLKETGTADLYMDRVERLRGVWEQYQLDLGRKSTSTALVSARTELDVLLKEEADKEAAEAEARARAAPLKLAELKGTGAPTERSGQAEFLAKYAPWAAAAAPAEERVESPYAGTHYTDGLSDDGCRRSLQTMSASDHDCVGRLSRPASAAVVGGMGGAVAMTLPPRPATAAPPAQHADESLLRSLHLELAKADDEIRHLKKQLHDTRGAQARFLDERVRVGVADYLHSDDFRARMHTSFEEGRTHERFVLQDEYRAWREKCQAAEASYMELYRGRATGKVG